MGEVKSVKVDNWGVFFLQKLQNFFNKTDYCDLTLQFRDNSQLKVHRLVLSACTDYFNVLEQTCEIVDDALIMPNEFQADVVVPIVNFMYTGTLEFELKMYGKLLRTAKEMNMTVLLKLLEAHRRTMENVNRQQRPPSPKGVRRRQVGPTLSGTSPQQRVNIPPPAQNRYSQVQGTNVGSATTMLRRSVDANANAPRGTSGTLLRTVGVNNRTQYITTSSDVTASGKQDLQATSPFEQLRKGYNNNKRPAQTSLLSPPSKKPNLEDVKEFAEQQRMRKQIAAEFGDQDQDYDGMMLYDDVHADDDDDDVPPQPSTSKQQQQLQQQQGTSQSESQTTQFEHGTTTIILKQDSPSQTPTIIVKDSPNTKLNHTKIIAEVLRQYPHIVKGHKNIRLKIMPNTTSRTEKPAVLAAKRNSPAPTLPQQSAITPPHKKLHVSFKSDKSTPIITTPQNTTRDIISDQKTVVTTTPSAPQTEVSTSSATTPATSTQKRRIDSKTMHALIALGAENTTGPWLCLRCGVNGRPISIPSYRGFRRHLVNTHKEIIDPSLCEQCGWRSTNNRELHFHMYTEHQSKSLIYTFAECALCNQAFETKSDLEKHISEIHTDDNKQQCIYCYKYFAQELQLYRHMKNYHKDQALGDGIIDETDEEYLVSQDEEDEQQLNEDHQQLSSVQHAVEKVRILSDISLPVASSVTQQQQEEALLQQTNEQEVKFVGADGNEVELTDEQRKEILSQLNQQQAGATSGGVVLVLSEGENKQENEDKSQTGTEDDFDDTQIFNELAGNTSASTENNKKIEMTSNSMCDDSKESIENLEWAENLISEQELEQADQSNKEPKTEKPHDDISEKLKELTGDWTEDENDDVDDKPVSTEVVAEVVDNKSTVPKPENDVDEQDDIDLALQSLHKDGEQQQTGDEQSIPDDESVREALPSTPIPSERIENSQRESATEKTNVDDVINTASVADTATATTNSTNVDQLLKIKEENEPEEEFIDETAVSTKTEISVEVAANNDVSLEAENIRKELLDELIAEGDKPIPEDELVPATQLLPSDDALEVEEATKAADVSDENVVSSKAIEEATEPSADSEKNANCSLAPSADEKPQTSETEDRKTTKTSDGDAASADKVKSLISEWADDDDDDDDDEVSAAAKEEL